MSSPREDLFEAYHSAVNSVGAAAVPLYLLALADCEDAIVQSLEHWSFSLLKLASESAEQEGSESYASAQLYLTLCQVVDESPWTSEALRAQAVYDGADRLGNAARHSQGAEDEPYERARAILIGVLAPQLADIAESHLQARIRWSMEHR